MVHAGDHGHGQNHRPGGSIGARLAVALWLTVGLVAIEAAAGLLANSLALLTDAAHNLTDVAALALSWFALRLQSRPASSARTFGYHRVGILVALVNSAGLLAMSLLVLSEAYRRLLVPSTVNAGALMAVGGGAFIVNLATALMIRRPGEKDLNLRSAFLHLVGDAASTAAAVAAGAGIYFTGANWLDPAASAVIAVLIMVGAWGVSREAIGILLEATPRDVDMQSLVDDMSRIPGVLGVHDLHVWSLSKHRRSMSAHVLTDDAGLRAGDRIRREISALLESDYNIAHATLQLECAGCEDAELYCELEDRVEVPPG
jgi:cobalt-zinc-cadmium efflux system protein